jgi:hypothetical protein
MLNFDVGVDVDVDVVCDRDLVFWFLCKLSLCLFFTLIKLTIVLEIRF